MAPIIDMSDVESFEPIPDGTYVATLSEDSEYIEESASSGEPYVKFVYDIDEGDYEGRKLFRNRSLQKKSLGYLKKDLIALGADPDDISGSFDIEDMLVDLKGNSVKLVVGHKDVDGELMNEVKRVIKTE